MSRTPREDVVKHLLFLMLDVASRPHMSGFQKRFYVLHRLNRKFKIHPEVQKLLPDIIRLIIAVDKRQIKINPVEKSSCLGKLCLFKKDGR